MAVFTLLAYAGYVLILGQSMPASAAMGGPSASASVLHASATLASHAPHGLQEIGL
jgi:hypothetical protein